LAPSLVVSTQLPLHRVGAAGGQPEAQEYDPPAPAQTGVLPEHDTPQLPQLAAVEYWTHAPLHGLKPLLQVDAQLPSWHTASVLAMLGVQILPHAPQLSVVSRFEQVPPQSVIPGAQAAVSAPLPSSGRAEVESGRTTSSPVLDSSRRESRPVSPESTLESTAESETGAWPVSPEDASGIDASELTPTDAPEAHAVASAAAATIAPNFWPNGCDRWLCKVPQINV
jgi:hypothetical protein